MANLPASPQPVTFMGMEIPGDITIGEARDFILKGDALTRLQSFTPKRLTLRFVWVDDDVDFPDSDTLASFRAAANAGLAEIRISDGGQPSRARTPELIDS